MVYLSVQKDCEIEKQDDKISTRKEEWAQGKHC